MHCRKLFGTRSIALWEIVCTTALTRPAWKAMRCALRKVKVLYILSNQKTTKWQVVTESNGALSTCTWKSSNRQANALLVKMLNRCTFMHIHIYIHIHIKNIHTLLIYMHLHAGISKSYIANCCTKQLSSCCCQACISLAANI